MEVGQMKPEIIETSSALNAIIRGEVDMQVSTAKAYPREISTVKDKVLKLATLTSEIAEGCFYAINRGGKPITGPSVRLAEIVSTAYGNIRAGSRVIGMDARFVTCQGVCHDLETNFHASVEVKRRITYSNGNRFNDDMIGVTTNAGLSIAFRNAVFKVVPMVLFADILPQITKVGLGDERTFNAKVDAAFDYYKQQGYKEDMVFELLQIKSKQDVEESHLITLRGILNAVKDSETTLEQTFSEIVEKKKSDKLKNGKANFKKDAPKEEPKTKSEDEKQDAPDTPEQSGTPNNQPNQEQEEQKEALFG